MDNEQSLNTNKMEENIFLTLGKYKYNYNKRKNKDEKDLNEEENYFTEAFALVLDKNRETLGKYFLQQIDEKEHKLKNFDIKSIETQPYQEGKVPDIKIELNDGNTIFIENKINSSERKDQIKGYLKEGFVIFITLKDDYKENLLVSEKKRFLGHFRWYKIYKLLEDYKKNNSKKGLLKEFLEFMEVLKMKPINIIGIKKLLDKEILETYENLLRLKEEIIKNLKNIEGIHTDRSDDYPREYEVEDGELYLDIGISKFQRGKNKSRFYYGIDFYKDNGKMKISVSLIVNKGLSFDQEIMNKVEIMNKENSLKYILNDSGGGIYIEKDLDEVFNSNKKIQEEEIIYFVIESIKKFNNELLTSLT